MKFSVKDYPQHVREHLLPMLRSVEAVRVAGLVALAPTLVALLMLDLGPARALLQGCYAPGNAGRPPWCPVAMLRSLVAMAMCGETSFNKWAKLLSKSPEHAVSCGFEPGEVPGASTFYDFCRRLLDGPGPEANRRDWRRAHRPSRPLTSRRFRRNLKLDKEIERLAKEQTDERPVRHAVNQALARLEAPSRQGLTERLGRILVRCAVVPSARLGLLGDSQKLDVGLDASTLTTHASSRGIPGTTADDGSKEFSDPEATFGWDSYREQYFFGHKLHGMAVNHGGRDLPIYLHVGPAHEHDSVPAADLLTEYRKLLREELPTAGYGHVIADTGYDAFALYELIRALDANPIIPLHPNSQVLTDVNEVKRNEQGVPLCVGGLPMRRHGYDREQDVTMYNCPVKRPGRENGKQVMRTHRTECPLEALCEPDSKMGPFVRLRVGDDPRMNLVVPRDTELYDALMNKRTAIERTFGWLKGPGRLGHRPYRRRYLFAIVATCKALYLHARAWVQERFGNLSTVEGLVEAIDQLAPAAAGTDLEVRTA